MTIRSLTLCALLVTLVGAAPALADDSSAAQLQRAIDDLDVMEALLNGRVSEATRRELLKKVLGVRADVVDVQQNLLRGATTAGVDVSLGGGQLVSITMQVDEGDMGFDEPEPVPPMPLEEPAGPAAMSADQLRTLLGAVRAEAFGDSALGVLRDACRANHFDVGQAVTLVSIFDFGDDKVEAAAMLYPRLVDPGNFYQIYGAFDFDSDKEALRERLGL